MSKPPARCILHAGIAKTGTTSIQYYLANNADSNADFVYCHFKGIQSDFELVNLFHSDPLSYHEYNIGNLSVNLLDEYRQQADEYLRKQIKKAVEEDKILILSWEGCWHYFDKKSKQSIRKYFENKGFFVEVIIYIRPWKELIESRFQQRIKGLSLNNFQIVPSDLSDGIKNELITFEEVFGSSSVKIFKYDPVHFEKNDVVRHFCQQIGIPHAGTPPQRFNDSLCIHAIKLLYAYNQFGPLHGFGPAAKINYQLIPALLALKGPPLRLHSSLLEPVAGIIERENPWLQQKLAGSSMWEDIFKHDNEPMTIRNESDMFNFSPDSLKWLAAQINGRPVTPVSGEQAAQNVAVQIHTLYKKIHRENLLYYRLIRKAKTVIKHVIMKFIPTTVAFLCCLSVANAQFPGTWQGDWSGTLDIFNGSGKVQSVEMTVEIHKIDTSTQGRYTFGLVYGSKEKDWRPYELVPVSPETGIWKVDEKNSIMMESFLMGPKFLCWFVVQQSRVLCTYEKVDDSTMIFEVLSGIEANISSTGNTTVNGEDIPEVKTYPFSVFQRAVLKRK